MIDESSTRHSESDRIDHQKTVVSFRHGSQQPAVSSHPGPSVAKPDTLDVSGRYEIKDEINRGGMGVILNGRDNALQRDLAIKLLRKSKADRPGISRRFIEEAQIAGQLQHPGIVPIYDVGELEDGRPFFSMKKVQGETLGQLLNSRETLDQDLIRYLGIFEQVCQAIAYAHTRRVIHRDLKPANVMVGAFGEVQVMDWGLAKIVDDYLPLAKGVETGLGHSLDDSDVRTTRNVELEAGIISSEPQAYTQLGSVVGTLAYMPPEQARGALDLIDERVDVFALGAILACVLTGKPPYVNASSGALHRMAEEGDLHDCFHRLEASGCDLRLQAILRNALAPDLDHRTPDAGTLALEISGYIASVTERLNEAKVESAAALAREEEAVKATIRIQKRSKITVAMAAIAVLASLMAGLGVYVAQQNKAARVAAENASRVTAAQFEVQKARGEQAVSHDLENRLAICESFLEQSETPSAVRPTNESMARIGNILDHVKTKLEMDFVGNDLAIRHCALRQRYATLNAAIEIVDQLESIRTSVVAHELEGVDHFLFVAGQPEKTPVPQGRRYAARLYRLLEQRWTLRQSSRQEITNEILAMPEWAQPPIIDGLKELHRQFSRPETSMLCDAATWHALEMTDHKTNGSILSQLPDGSILASGCIPDGDRYHLSFSSDVQKFTAIKIEALTAPSLPMLGPGRNTEGDFTIGWMQFLVASKSKSSGLPGNPDNSARARFKEPVYSDAFTTFQSPNSTFNSHRWQCVMAPAEDQHAVLMLKEPAVSDDGFNINLQIRFNGSGQWGDQSLGCFRVSVASIPKRAAVLAFATAADEIADLVINARNNDWERQYWQSAPTATEGDSVHQLLKLASTPDFDQQHSVYAIRLAETLKEKSEVWWIDQMNQHCDWQVIDADDVQSNIPTRPMDDGSWLVGEPELGNSDVTGRYRHTFRFRSRRPVSHLKFEFMRDDSLPLRGPGRGVNTGRFAIAEIKLARHGQPVSLQTARSDFPPTVDTEIGRANDRDPVTFWRPYQPHHTMVQTAIFQVCPDACKDGLLDYEVEIESGRPSTAAHDTLGRFRISWCGDNINTVQPNLANVAMKILDDQYMKAPANYTTLVSLARAAALKNPPDHELAANYGWTAYALKPNDSNSILIAVRTILRRNPQPGSAELSRAIQLAKKAKAIDFKSGAIEQVVHQQINVANAHYGQRDFPRAELAYRTAHDLSPDNFLLNDRWGHCLTEIGDLEKGQAVLLQRYRSRPHDSWLRVHLGHNAIARKDYAAAAEYLAPVIENSPGNLVALLLNVQVAEQRGDFTKVIQLLERHESLAPLRAGENGYRYRALFETNRIAEVAEQLPTALQRWPDATALHSDCCLILAASEKLELLTSAFETAHKHHPLQLGRITENVFLTALAVGGSSSEPPAAQFPFRFRSPDSIGRFCDTALKTSPNLTILNRLNCVVKLRQKKWKQAISALERSDAPQSAFCLLAKAWCQYELDNVKAANDLVKQSLCARGNQHTHELNWLKKQLATLARDPDGSILQIFGPAIQIVSSKP